MSVINAKFTYYQEQTTSAKLRFDPAQQRLVEELNQFLSNFASLNFITRLWRKDHKLGYYIYGDVGRGKSMIMNAMYQYTDVKRKTRLHFHEFMHETHEKLAKMVNVDDPLAVIAKELKEQFDIIYLDEMHVSESICQ
jgi:cell division protein ZapE